MQRIITFFSRINPSRKNSFLLPLIIFGLCYSSFSQPSPRKKILILHSYHITYLWTSNITKGVQSVLDEEKTNIDISVEFLDSKQSFDTAYQSIIYNMLYHKYSNQDIDLIICSDDDALTFLVDYRNKLFGEIPVVFCGVNEFGPNRLKGQKLFTGLIETVDIENTINLACHLAPSLEKIYVISDNTTTGTKLRLVTDSIRKAKFKNIEFEFLYELPLKGIIERTQNVSKNAAILILPYTTEISGRLFEMEKVVEIISENSPVPVYSLWDFVFNHGIVGGKILSGYKQGVESAIIADRILNGESISNIPIVMQSPSDYMIDHSQAKRLQLNLNNLPPDTIIENKDPMFFEKNKNVIFIFSSLISILIILFVFFFFRQKRKKNKLISEISFRQQLIDSIPIPVYFKDNDGLFIGANKAFLRLIGKPVDQILKKPLQNVIKLSETDPLLDNETSKSIKNRLKAFETEIYDTIGSKRKMIFYKSLINDHLGNPNGLITAMVDITEQISLINKLKESDAIFDLIIKASNNGIFDWKLNEGHVFFSPNWKKMLGYSIDEIPPGFNSWVMLLHPEDKKKSISKVLRCFRRKQKHYKAEFRMLCKDGSYKWIMAQAYTTFDDKNNPIRLTGSHIDINHNKTMLLELQLMAEIFNNSLMGIGISLPNSTNFYKVNEAYAQMHGYSANELNGQPIITVYAPQEYSKLETYLQKNPITDHQVYETIHIHRNGKLFPVLVHVTNVFDNKGILKFSIVNTQDLTERKKTDQKIRTQASFIKNVMDTSPTGIVVLNPDGEFLLVNATAEKILETNKSIFSTRLFNDPEWEITDFYNQPLHDDKHPFYLAKTYKKPFYNIEFAVKLPNKSRKYLLLNAAPVINNKNLVEAVVITIEDITYRKHLEEEKSQLLVQEQSLNEELRTNEEELLQNLQQTLRLNEAIAESEKKFQTFLNTSEDFIFLKDNKLKYIFVNETFCHFLNLESKDIIGQTDSTFLPKELLSFNNETDPLILKSGTFLSNELQIGNTIFEIKKFPVEFSGNITGIGGFFRNITEKKHNEERILENEKRFRTLLENAVDTIFILNEFAIITYASGAIEKIFHKKNDAVIGKPFFNLIQPSEKDKVTESFFNTINSPGKTSTISYKFTSDKNETRFLQSIFVNYSDNPLIKGLLVTTRDITDHTQSEQLRKNIEIARKAAEAKQQFLANMSHEIRTPMNGILGMTDFLIKTTLNDEQLDFVETIKSSAETLLNIINDILDLSKIEAGKMPIKPGVIKTSELVINLEKVFIALAKEKDLKFIKTINPQFPQFIISDPVRLNQVFLNLLSNAIKFTPQGTITLKLDIKEISANQCTVYAEISDTGIGITPENQEKLFSAFSQVDSSLIRSSEGTGLGLAISKKIINMLGGEINVVSQPNHGSTFWFTFQAGIAALPHSEYEISEPDKDNKTNIIHAKILLVEDKFVNQKVITLMLESLGCQVWIANNGKQAIEMIKKEAADSGNPSSIPYDIIFMDIQMPVMDGITATRIIKESYQSIPPIIGLSANALEGDAEKYIQQGMDDYVSKPVKSEILLDKINFWVKKENTNQTVNASIQQIQLELKNIMLLDKTALETIIHQAKYNQIVLQEAFISFLFEGHALYEKIKAQLAKNEYPDAENTLDQILGLSMTMGAKRAIKACNYLYEAISSQNIELSTKILPLLLNSIEEFHQEISTSMFT